MYLRAQAFSLQRAVGLCSIYQFPRVVQVQVHGRPLVGYPSLALPTVRVPWIPLNCGVPEQAMISACGRVCGHPENHRYHVRTRVTVFEVNLTRTFTMARGSNPWIIDPVMGYGAELLARGAGAVMCNSNTQAQA